MKELYVVSISMGKWDDAYTFAHGIFDDRSKAEAEVKRVTQHYRKLKRTRLPFPEAEYWRRVKRGVDCDSDPEMLAHGAAWDRKYEGEQFKSADIQVFQINMPLALKYAEGEDE